MSASGEILMTSIFTDRHADLKAQLSLLKRVSEQAFTVTFLLASAVATVGWLYTLSEGAMAVASWLFL